MRVDASPKGDQLALYKVEYKLWEGAELRAGIFSERVLATNEITAAREVRHLCQSDGRTCEIVDITEIESVSALVVADCQGYLNAQLQQQLGTDVAAIWEELKRQSNYMQDNRRALRSGVAVLPKEPGDDERPVDS